MTEIEEKLWQAVMNGHVEPVSAALAAGVDPAALADLSQECEMWRRIEGIVRFGQQMGRMILNQHKGTAASQLLHLMDNGNPHAAVRACVEVLKAENSPPTPCASTVELTILQDEHTLVEFAQRYEKKKLEMIEQSGGGEVMK